MSKIDQWCLLLGSPTGCQVVRRTEQKHRSLRQRPVSASREGGADWRRRGRARLLPSRLAACFDPERLARSLAFPNSFIAPRVGVSQATEFPRVSAAHPFMRLTWPCRRALRWPHPPSFRGLHPWRPRRPSASCRHSWDPDGIFSPDTLEPSARGL